MKKEEIIELFQRENEFLKSVIKNTQGYEDCSYMSNDIEYCAECGVQTSGRLESDCGYISVCSGCVDGTWDDSFQYDNDGINRSMFNSYYK